MAPKQMSLSMEHDAGFERHRKATRRDVFLAEMDQVVPWVDLCAVIAPHYPKDPVGGGRRPVGLERMLRIHFLQQWYALSDPAVEEALYDSVAMRRFVGIDLGQEGAPDETTVCKFRHLLEKHGLAEQLFAAVSRHLKDHGMKLSQGTIVDATIIAAAPSTKNKAKARDPEMHQTKKGQQWYLGSTQILRTLSLRPRLGVPTHGNYVAGLALPRAEAESGALAASPPSSLTYQPAVAGRLRTFVRDCRQLLDQAAQGDHGDRTCRLTSRSGGRLPPQRATIRS